jgi:hypothetical protein
MCTIGCTIQVLLVYIPFVIVEILVLLFLIELDLIKIVIAG